MSRDHDVSERALARVLSEARGESAPELDWARIESRLDALPASPDIDTPRPRALLSALILAAAGVALAIGWYAAGGRAPIAAPAVPHAESRALDGDTLASGTRITSPIRDVMVEHRGHSQWTLERGGRARVISADGVVRIELEQGAIAARVVPSSKKETFVVEAASTRVAVHGTAFRVSLETHQVDVSVTEGTVLVGPRDKPGFGHAVGANENSSFSLAGAPLIEEAVSTTARRAPPHLRPAPTAERAPELVPQPSIEAVETLVSQVLDLGASCFQSRTATANGVRVTASTLCTIRALPDGRVELLSLDPPLAPPVQSCLNEGVQKLSMAPSRHGIQVTRRMELER